MEVTGEMAVDERRRIAHLLRRAGFGATEEELDAYQQIGFEKSVDQLLHPEQVDDSDLDQTLMAMNLDAPEVPQALQIGWLYRMAHTRRPLAEKIALLWHGHFATSIVKVKSVTLMQKQIDLFRTQGLGSFEQLVLAVSRDPAMLIWLDNAKSKKQAANENYGRELMERFTLGVGNYTEDDVKASSRAFTGWSLRITPGATVGDTDETDPELAAVISASDRSTPAAADTAEDQKAAKKQQRAVRRTRDAEFLFRPAWHDDGQKTFLGQTGDWDGADIIRIILEQPACADFIATQLFSFFVWDNPDKDTVAPFAETFTKTSGDIRQTLSALFLSDEFSSDRAYRALVKSPIEFAASTIKLLGANVGAKPILDALERMGQVPGAPPNVGGWTSGLGWIGPSALLDRYNFAHQVVSGDGRPGGGGIDPRKVLGTTLSDKDAIIDAATELLLTGDIDDDQRSALAAYLASGTTEGPPAFDATSAEAEAKLRGLIRLVMTIPAYQLN
jgi:uncharacterized protein (DUF1800 family)